ncbi:LysR family transcriptional regulator [Pseudomonas sp. BP8]|uniref:LysR family transcriptional regulator n=1 Tax=Pseudomonas sp. BP8 TaxID=2817864 RepID=UPI001AE8693B|nr:LysR family transcriptional regulator [Pseudomonas sp. BP8]MBP2262545.1 LysR family glycine cleavage system transcriptional activator [Pseudomonas sp. BP8]HDS1733739.1 LysR family transcriptional regulator [Pseudomonas putida]
MPLDSPLRHSLQLNALRAFEASARLGGFARAAKELKLTPGAIAALVKALEREYGAALFERYAKGVRLTPLGETLKAQFTEAFDAVEEAARTLRRLAAPQRVHIVTSPALAQLWLGPRLPRLTELLAPIEISVTAVDEPPNLKRSPFDLCLFYTPALERGQRRLADEALIPVCAPALASQLKAPEDLLGVRCIADVVWNDWEVWTGAVMPERPFIAGGPGFSLYSIAVQQALLAAGVLIGRRSLVQRYLDSGELVAPIDCSVPLGMSIAAWTLPVARGNRVVAAVEDALAQLA